MINTCRHRSHRAQEHSKQQQNAKGEFHQGQHGTDHVGNIHGEQLVGLDRFLRSDGVDELKIATDKPHGGKPKAAHRRDDVGQVKSGHVTQYITVSTGCTKHPNNREGIHRRLTRKGQKNGPGNPRARMRR